MKSILSKLWLGITILVIIMIMLIWSFQIFFLNTFYIRERINVLREEGTQLATSITEKLNDKRLVSEEVKDELDSYVSSYGEEIVVISNNDKILYSSRNAKNPQLRIKSLSRTNDFKESISSGEIYIKRRKVELQNSTYIIVGVPLSYNDRIVGAIVLSSPIQTIKEAITILRRQLSIITLLSVAIGTILALLLAKVFTKPIFEINKTAIKISKGNFSAKVDIDSKDEFGALANTINNLSTQMGQTEKFRREFIANTSHELKTPISLIRAYAELIEENVDEDKEKRNEYLDIIVSESERLNNMVEDMLYLSKMEAGYNEPKFEEFNIIDTIKSVSNKLSPIAEENSIILSHNFDSEEIFITADEDKMQHVFLNLVNNAIIHSSSNTTVLIKVKETINYVTVEVIDNGVGIPEEDLPHIWDRFYKVDKSRKRSNNGTGLGMAIVKNILDTHNFKYGIKSKVNKGTNIWIEIKK